MGRYHFNPKTGNSGECKAEAGKCPFLLEGSRHFDSKEEARSAAEEYFEKPYGSKAARLLVMKSRIQREIFSKLDGVDRQDRDQESLNKLVAERRALEYALDELEPEPGEPLASPVTGEHQLVHGVLSQETASGFIGLQNNIEELRKKNPETFKAGFELSELWLQSLSTEDAKALQAYSGSPRTAHETGAVLSESIKRAPRLKPTKVYSGLSRFVADDFLSQVESGVIETKYPMSSSLNVAQANGFMRTTLDGKPRVAVEIETTVGGSLMAVTHVPHEFEVLLPAGRYEVLETLHDKELLWGEGSSGRTADIFLKLRRLEEPEHD